MAGGKTQVLISGQLLTNSFVYHKYNSLGYASIGILVDMMTNSGVSYTIRGYPFVGINKTRSIWSGNVLASGDGAYLVLEDPYEQIDVGVRTYTSNSSGLVTVWVTGKRR